jgi:hypothetical protein
VDPRTFLPGAPVAVAAVPAVGDRAPALPVTPAGSPTVVAFLRHVGCPFAEATFRSLRQRAAGTPDVRFLAVSHAPHAATAHWCETVAGDAETVELVVDEQRTLYGSWGLGRSSLSHFLGLRSLRSVAALARQGVRNRHPVGTRWQTAGTFAMDADWVVRFVNVPAHPGELPDLDAAVAAAVGGFR